MKVLDDLFGTTKPLVAMVHFPALPGRPDYNPDTGLEGILAHVRQDLHNLQDAGVDGLLFCNEKDIPYVFETPPELAATMAYIIGRVHNEVKVPFGVDVLLDPVAAIRLAAATGAAFVREVFFGTFESDLGFWSPRGSEAIILRKHLDIKHVPLFVNITPEFAQSIAGRSIAERARNAVFLGADAILISGQLAGEAADPLLIWEAKEAVPGVPVFANTGVSPDNVDALFSVADGAFCGTRLKVDEYIWNPVDPARARALMDKIHALRAS